MAFSCSRSPPHWLREGSNWLFDFCSRNETLYQLRPLDPYSQRKLDEVRSKYQYMMSQISEVNAKLDLMWEEFKSHKRPQKWVSLAILFDRYFCSVCRVESLLFFKTTAKTWFWSAHSPMKFIFFFFQWTSRYSLTNRILIHSSECHKSQSPRTCTALF